MSRLWGGVVGEVEEVFPDATRAGSFGCDATAVLVRTPRGERVYCVADGERGKHLLVLDAGDVIACDGTPWVARDPDARPILALDAQGVDLVVEHDEPPRGWRLGRLFLRAIGVGARRPLLRRLAAWERAEVG